MTTIRKLIEKLPHETKGRLGSPLFVRYYLKRQPPGDGPTKTIGIYLHEFLRSDPDKHHSHPWKWAIVIVFWGGYVEERISGFDGAIERRRRGPGSIFFLTTKTRHRVILEPGQRSWSLCIVGPRVSPWFIGNLKIYEGAHPSDADTALFKDALGSRVDFSSAFASSPRSSSSSSSSSSEE